MKKLLIGVVVVAVAMAAAAALSVNELVGGAVERGSTYALGVSTRVGFVRLALLDGSFRLARLRIGNPAGFDQDHFLTLHDARMDVDLSSLRRDVVVVPVLSLDGVDVILEKSGTGATNYGVILQNVKRFESGGARGAAAAPPQGGGKRFIVQRLRITDVTARVEWSRLASDATAVHVNIPEIDLHDLGAAHGKGVTLAELSNIVLKAVLGSVARYGGDLPAAMLSELEGGLAGLTRLTGVAVSGIGGSAVEEVGKALGGEVGDAVRGVGGDAAKSVGDAVGSSAGKALKGLFGGKHEEEPAP